MDRTLKYITIQLFVGGLEGDVEVHQEFVAGDYLYVGDVQIGVPHGGCVVAKIEKEKAVQRGMRRQNVGIKREGLQRGGGFFYRLIVLGHGDGHGEASAGGIGGAAGMDHQHGDFFD